MVIPTRSASTPPVSPILSIENGNTQGVDRQPTHSHLEPLLLWSSTATVMGTIGSRDWLIPPAARSGRCWASSSGTFIRPDRRTTVDLSPRRSCSNSSHPWPRIDIGVSMPTDPGNVGECNRPGSRLSQTQRLHQCVPPPQPDTGIAAETYGGVQKHSHSEA